MTPDEIKQATDALISDRTQLSAQAQAATQSNPPPLPSPAIPAATQSAAAATKP